MQHWGAERGARDNNLASRRQSTTNPSPKVATKNPGMQFLSIEKWWVPPVCLRSWSKSDHMVTQLIEFVAEILAVTAGIVSLHMGHDKSVSVSGWIGNHDCSDMSWAPWRWLMLLTTLQGKVKIKWRRSSRCSLAPLPSRPQIGIYFRKFPKLSTINGKSADGPSSCCILSHQCIPSWR